jgi:hypothetical protein
MVVWRANAEVSTDRSTTVSDTESLEATVRGSSRDDSTLRLQSPRTNTMLRLQSSRSTLEGGRGRTRSRPTGGSTGDGASRRRDDGVFERVDDTEVHMPEETTRTDDIERKGNDVGVTRRRALAVAASGALGTAGAFARTTTAAEETGPNAAVYESSVAGEYVAENYDTGSIAYRGSDFVRAMQAAVDSLDWRRTRKEKVLVSASGETGTHEWDGSVEGVDLPSNTIFEVTGTIHVNDDGEELVVPVRASDAIDIEIPELHVTGNPRYGMHLRSVTDVTIGTVTMSLWDTTDVGLGVRIDDSRGGRCRNVSLEYAYVEGSEHHAVETYGVDGFTAGTVETVDTGGCGLLLNDTTDATVQRVDATRADQGGGYAGFRCANDAGPNVTLKSLRAVDCGRGFFTVSGSRGIEIYDVHVERCGGCLVQDTQNVLVSGGSITGNAGSGVRIDSRHDDDYPHSRNVTVQDLELVGNQYGVR